MHVVAVLALPDVVPFDLATPLEVFGWAGSGHGADLYRTVICGPSLHITAGSLTLSAIQPMAALEQADTVVVPGRHDPLRPSPPAILHALRDLAHRGVRIASLCVGAFTLAEAGLLDGRRAATHWAAAGELARRFPRVDVDATALYVDDGPVLTSAGASAGLDLCLHLVARDHGPAVAAGAARMAVAPLHRTGDQRQYMGQLPGPAPEPWLLDVLAWLETNISQPVGIGEIARVAGVSDRTLHRRFRETTGRSPMAWVTETRIRQARSLLESSTLGVEQVGRAVGFETPASFRARFRAAVGVSPAQYRSTVAGT